jgi:hypothetical protein
LLERHRLVNAALEEEMKEIHALSIKKALTPEQWKQQQEPEKLAGGRARDGRESKGPIDTGGRRTRWKRGGERRRGERVISGGRAREKND